MSSFLIIKSCFIISLEHFHLLIFTVSTASAFNYSQKHFLLKQTHSQKLVTMMKNISCLHIFTDTSIQLPYTTLIQCFKNQGTKDLPFLFWENSWGLSNLKFFLITHNLIQWPYEHDWSPAQNGEQCDLTHLFVNDNLPSKLWYQTKTCSPFIALLYSKNETPGVGGKSEGWSTHSFVPWSPFPVLMSATKYCS